MRSPGIVIQSENSNHFIIIICQLHNALLWLSLHLSILSVNTNFDKQ